VVLAVVGISMNKYLLTLRKKAQGLTLIELLVTIAIIVILALVGVPSYETFMAKERFAIATNELYNSYRFARNEALKTSRSMTLDAKEVGGVTDWANGWQVTNSSGAMLFESKKPHQSVTVSGAVVTVTGMGSANSVSFTITGDDKCNELLVLSSGQSQLREVTCP